MLAHDPVHGLLFSTLTAPSSLFPNCQLGLYADLVSDRTLPGLSSASALFFLNLQFKNKDFYSESVSH